MLPQATTPFVHAYDASMSTTFSSPLSTSQAVGNPADLELLYISFQCGLHRGVQCIKIQTCVSCMHPVCVLCAPDAYPVCIVQPSFAVPCVLACSLILRVLQGMTEMYHQCVGQLAFAMCLAPTVRVLLVRPRTVLIGEQTAPFVPMDPIGPTPNISMIFSTITIHKVIVQPFIWPTKLALTFLLYSAETHQLFRWVPLRRWVRKGPLTVNRPELFRFTRLPLLGLPHVPCPPEYW